MRHLDSIKIHSVCVCVVVEDCTSKERCIILHLTLPPKLAPTILAINCSIVARTRFFHKCTDRTLLLSSERGSILIRNLVYKPCRENLCVVKLSFAFAYLLDFFSRPAFLCRLTRCVSASIISKDRVTQSTKVGENALNFSSSFFSP